MLRRDPKTMVVEHRYELDRFVELDRENPIVVLRASQFPRSIGQPSRRLADSSASETLTDRIARELYDLEANEVMGTVPVQAPDAATIPVLGTAAAA